MGQWEYRTIRIDHDRKKRKNWVVEVAGKPPLIRLSTILDAHGADGWELVNLAPEHFEAAPGFGKWYADPTVYRATFKRPVEEA